MKDLNKYMAVGVFYFFAAAGLYLIDGVCAEDDGTTVKGHVTIVGRIPDADREAVGTVKNGNVVTVGKRSETATLGNFLQKVPTTIFLMVDPSDAYRVVESDMNEMVKSFDFVKSVKWDKKKSTIILTIDTGSISAEAGGRKVVQALRSKFNIRFIEGSVRR